MLRRSRCPAVLFAVFAMFAVSIAFARLVSTAWLVSSACVAVDARTESRAAAGDWRMVGEDKVPPSEGVRN
jgi:hypothetical protein